MSDHTANAELLRLQCLQALGIAVYHPRFRLPGAKPSVECEWPEAARAETPRATAASRKETAPVEAPRPAVAPVNTPQGAPKRAEPAPRVAPGAGTSAQSPQPRVAESTTATMANFQLLFLQVDDDLALVNQIPALARPQLQDKQFALLGNLLRWLGKPVPMQAPRVFRWPLPGLEHMAAGMSAETSLLHFLEQASTERGFRFLLQLGPQAAAPSSPAWQAFTTHSLDEMLALPALKREVWQSLLPLHAQLRAKA